MNHQRQHSHADPTHDPAADDELSPGKVASSSQLKAPGTPVESPLLAKGTPQPKNDQTPVAKPKAKAAPAAGAGAAPAKSSKINLDGATHGNATGFDGSTINLGGRPQTKAQWRPVDGLIDYYMETHWNRKEFDKARAEIGDPDGAPSNALSEVDKLMPANVDPAVRATINLAVAVGSGVLDAMVMTALKSIPGTGMLWGMLDGTRAAVEGFDKYGKLDDTLGQELTFMRGGFDAVGNIVDNLGSTLGMIKKASQYLKYAAGAVGAIEVAAALASIEKVAATMKLGLDAASAAVNTIKLVIDAVLFSHNQTKATEAEARGDFATAAKYHDLAQGNLIDGFGDTVALVSDLIDVADVAIGGLPSGTYTKTAGSMIQKGVKAAPGAVKGAAKWLVQSKLGAAGNGAQVGGGIRQNVTGLGGTLGAVGGTINNVAGQVGLGDQMLVDDDLPGGRDYLDRKRAGGGTGPLAAARAQTVAQLDGDEKALESAPVFWYEQLVNELVAPKDTDAGDVASLMTPSGLIKAALGQVPALLGKLSPENLEAVANGAESLAATAQGALGPLIAQVSGFIRELKPKLDPMVQGLAKKVTDSQLNLDRIRSMINTMSTAAAKVQDGGAPVAQVDSMIGQMLAAIGGGKLTRDKLPSALPDAIATQAVGAVNSPLGAAEHAVHQLKSALVERVRTWIAYQGAAFRAKIGEWQHMLDENSEFVAGMKAMQGQLQQLVAQAAAAFAKWDGTIKLDLGGAGAWLKQIGAAARKAKEVEGGRGKDAGGGGQTKLTWPEKAVEARLEIDTWKQSNAARVESQFHTRVPAHELAACTALYDAAKARAAGKDTSKLDAAHAACMKFRGQQGRDAVYGLWAAEDQLAAIAQSF